MMAWIKKRLESNTYYVVLLVVTLIFAGLLTYFGAHNLFYELYKINAEGVNSSFISFFGIIFGFLFTSLAILFSLNDKSYFIKLLQENDRNRNDIIGYFSIGIVTSLIIVLISLFLTVTFINSNNSHLINETLIQSVNACKYPIYALFYLIIFDLINLLMLIFMFINLLRESK